MQIAIDAGLREIVQVVRASMSLWDNMLDMKRGER